MDSLKKDGGVSTMLFLNAVYADCFGAKVSSVFLIPKIVSLYSPSPVLSASPSATSFGTSFEMVFFALPVILARSLVDNDSLGSLPSLLPT